MPGGVVVLVLSFLRGAVWTGLGGRRRSSRDGTARRRSPPACQLAGSLAVHASAVSERRMVVPSIGRPLRAAATASACGVPSGSYEIRSTIQPAGRVSRPGPKRGTVVTS